MGSLKISVALWSLGTPPTMPEWEKVLDTAASTGVKAVQPWCVDEKKWNLVCAIDPDRCVTAAQRSEIRKACEKRGLAISGFCAQLAGPKTLGGFGEEDAGLPARIEKTKKALRLAAEVGSPIVTTHIGPIPEDRKAPAYARFVKTVGEVMRDAERSGGIFALETGQESAAGLKQFIEDVGSPNLKVNYDPANMLKHGPVEGVSILAKYIVHTHAKDKHPETGKPTVGQGAVPWKDYIAALKKIGYDGWYALEDESNDPDVVESITTGRKFLEQF
ncbi:MAG TPA: sugar phosphate isomerase/epimerase family protein [Planctomycetota bacterium]|nr:sugar phosphate isomerase/epimerase family protein [Planctomycetota bacterium]